MQFDEDRKIAPPRRRPMLILTVVLLGGIALVAGLWFLRVSNNAPAVADSREYQPPSEEGYIGSQACAECHRDIAETYRKHPMARTLRRVDTLLAESLVQPTRARVDGTQRVYEVEFRDDALAHHERMYDAAGELIYDQAVPMDYAVGSGRRAVAFLYQRDSLLFMSPLNWYSGSRTWDLAPGYTPDDPRRFDRRVTDECLSCHSGRVAAVGRSLNRYKSPPFREMSIGCENCHGPGRSHVAFHAAGTAHGSATDLIVNPARLDPVRRESVCNQCHLQGAARIPRYTRSDFDFRPGQSLEEIWTVLVADSGVTEDGKTRSVNHVQQLHESRCFVESNGRFGCISCHDPHRVPADAERATFYRDKCFQCHKDGSCSSPRQERLAKQDSCIACHMPAREASNVSHVSQTDHRILRAPRPSSASSGGEHADNLSFFNRADLRLEPWERSHALGIAIWLHMTKHGREPPSMLGYMLGEALEAVPDDGVSLTVLGAQALNGNFVSSAQRYYEQALAIPAAEEAALAGLLKVNYLSSNWGQAVEYADRLLAIDPCHAPAYSMRADSLKQLGRLAEGAEAARRALECNPTLTPVREWLAAAYRDLGRLEEHQEQEDLLRRMRTARPPQPAE